MPSPFSSSSIVGQTKSLLPSVEPWTCWAWNVLGTRPDASIFTVNWLPSSDTLAEPDDPLLLSASISMS
jgi:hypothetical protein